MRPIRSVTDEAVWSPRLNLAWRVDPRSVVRASWGRFYQSQRPYELQVEDAEQRLFPAERSEANGITSETGNSRSLRTLRIVDPTSPVAPSTPTLYPSPVISL